VSRDALSGEQFDLLVTSQRDVEKKRRADRAGIRAPEEGTVSGSKQCENCGMVKRGVARDRRSGKMLCDDCWRAGGGKSY
jgi:formylmethanofuran dehydrogenase subunit E